MGASKPLTVPDIGDFDDVEVIEILVAKGDSVVAEQSVVTLESDKATMEIPSAFAGTVREIHVAIGDKVSQGTELMTLDVADADAKDAAAAAPAAPAAAAAEQQPTPSSPSAPQAAAPEAEQPATSAAPASRSAPAAAEPAQAPQARSGAAHASPSVRRLARELGVDLTLVPGSGRKQRIVKEDVQGFVKSALAGRAAPGAAAGGLAVAPMPKIDFSKFGEIEVQELHKIRRVSARNLHRSWVTVPHVTQFDEADITNLEQFRKSKAEEAKQRGIKLTPLAFLLKAVEMGLREFPQFNSSLDPGGEALILKKYFHIGVAVDTENGLVVPVIRDVDSKGLFALAEELADVSLRARERKLSPQDLSGGCFSISSLGGIGGTAFTPIVNAPEVAILGVSRSKMKPIYQDGAFVARLMLPVSLSYDHRVIDGADAARFTKRLCEVLSDIRNLVL